MTVVARTESAPNISPHSHAQPGSGVGQGPTDLQRPRRKYSVVPEELLWEGRGKLPGYSYLGRCASSRRGRGGMATTSQRTSETDGQDVNTARSKYPFRLNHQAPKWACQSKGSRGPID